MWSARTRPPVRRLLGLGLAGGLAVGGFSACGDETAPTSAGTTPSSSAPTETADPSESTTPSPSPTPAPDVEEGGGSTSSTTVPVYFVADAPQGQRLFREFRSVDAEDPLAAAGALLTGRSILDPDYASLLPRGSFADVREGDGGKLEVILADPTWSEQPAGMSAQQARLAVQQVVYTLQGVVQSREAVVAYSEDGGAPVDLFGVPTAKGVMQAKPLQVLGLVNVTSPEEATTVGKTFVASGVASSFEGNVPWEVRQGSRVVLDGNATADGYLGKLYPWQADVDVSSLDAGTYTLVAMTDDSSGGEGFDPTEDTKDFTVE